MTYIVRKLFTYSLVGMLGAAGLGSLPTFQNIWRPGVALASDSTSENLQVNSAATRRLTSDQYRIIIEDVFGPTIRLGGRFEPELRVDGLFEVGASLVSVSPAGMEQYDAMARTIASQVVDDEHRNLLVSCSPRLADEPDDVCAAKFLSEVGRLLFRRPLDSNERQAYVNAARDAAETLEDFYSGLSLSLGAMLASPQFLFRHETLEPDPAHPSEYRLDAYSKASRLSFFLWNSGPDLPLLIAAANGELNTEKDVTQQVERMLASPRLRDGARAFFTDMLHFDALDTLTKDTTIYPKFNAKVASDAREQTLRTLLYALVEERGDYRDIFTTKETFLTQELASLYKVPLVNNVPNGSPDTWQPYEFSENDPRAGVHMQISFVALHSHPGRSSPTLRGKALRETMLCQKVPAPPGDVSFTLVQDTSNPVYKTARARLQAHSTEPMCAGCHKITDPIGLALENFNGAGEWQTNENGEKIDTSGSLDGMAFEDGIGLGQVLRENPAVPSCLVDRISSYALGRKPSKTEAPWIEDLKTHFAESGYILPSLMKEIATSAAFFRAVKPEASEQKEAHINIK
jgi:hypothetical protein